MSTRSEEPLLTMRYGLSGTHLECAIDSTRMAIAEATSRSGFGLVFSTRRALSAILHAYAAVEAAANDEGHRMFVDSASPSYIPPASRGIALDLLVRHWPRLLSVNEKVGFIAERHSIPLPGRLDTELRELGTLRNCVAHGLSFEATLLVTLDSPGVYSVHDREDSVPWEQKFPNLKFHSLDRIDHEDARTALRVAVDALFLLVQATGVPVPVMDPKDGRYHIISLDRMNSALKFLADLSL